MYCSRGQQAQQRQEGPGRAVACQRLQQQLLKCHCLQLCGWAGLMVLHWWGWHSWTQLQGEGGAGGGNFREGQGCKGSGCSARGPYSRGDGAADTAAALGRAAATAAVELPLLAAVWLGCVDAATLVGVAFLDSATK